MRLSIVATMSVAAMSAGSASAQNLPGVDHNEVAFPVEQIVSYSVGSPYTVLGANILSSAELEAEEIGCQRFGGCDVSLLSGVTITAGTTNAISRISADWDDFVYGARISGGNGNPITDLRLETRRALTGIDYSSRTVVSDVTYNTRTETLRLLQHMRYKLNTSIFRSVFPGPTIRGRAISTTYIADVDRLGNGVDPVASVGMTKSRATQKEVDVAANLFCLKNGHIGAYSHTAVDVTLNDIGALPQRIVKSEVIQPWEKTLKSPGLGSTENMPTRDDVARQGKFSVYETIKCASSCHKDDLGCRNGRPVVSNIGQGSDGTVRWFWVILNGVDSTEVSKGKVELLLGTGASESTPIETAASASISSPELVDGGVSFAVVIPMGLNKTLEEGNLRVRFVNSNRGVASDIARVPGLEGNARASASPVSVESMRGFFAARQHIIEENVRVTNALNAAATRR